VVLTVVDDSTPQDAQAILQALLLV
jgi:hypothetical protein